MFIENDIAYQVFDRCQDLFPEWKKEGDQYWNSKTGEIIRKDGMTMHDLVYRGYKYALRRKENSGETSSDRSNVDNWVLNSPDLDIDEYLYDNSAPEAVFV